MTTTDYPWRILLVDDHPLVRDGLRVAVRRLLPSVRLEEASASDEALAKLESHRPHLVLLDVNLPDGNGLELARRIRERSSETKFLMVAGECDPWTVREALAIGAAGFVAKTRSASCLADGIEAVLEGGHYLCDDSRAALARSGLKEPTAPPEPPGPAVLSSREREILRYLVHGETTKGIALQLDISPKTVETHRVHIMRKLGIDSLAGLTRYAIRHRLVSA